jgi:hypothetical protein
MKVIRYTLLANGTIPSNVADGGYFIKQNGGQSPQDYDMIGLSLNWTVGISNNYTTKTSFENYIESFMNDYVHPLTGETVLIQDLIDNFWDKSVL